MGRLDGFALYPRQVKAVDAIVRAFDSGRDTVILEGPTGIGKSILAAELARRQEGRTFITTPLVTLVDQMYGDPKFRSLANELQFITGRQRWTCRRDPRITVAKAVCKEIDNNGVVQRSPETGKALACRYKRWDMVDMPECPYYQQKAFAELSQVTVTTLGYFLFGTTHVNPKNQPTQPVPGWDHGRLSGRDLLIVDEAHGLAESVVSFLTKSWDQASYTADERAYTTTFGDWLVSQDVYRYAESNREMDNSDDILVGVLTDLLQRLNAYGYRISTLGGLSAEKELDSLERDTELLGTAITDLRSGIPWVGKFAQEGTKTRFEIQPVVAAASLQRTVWSKAFRVVLQSATWTNIQGTISDLGLAGRKVRFLRVPSNFPAWNAPIFLVPVARLSKDNMREEFPNVIRALFRIMERETGRGLVHTATFDNAELVGLLAPQEARDRLWIHRRDENREDLLKRFMHNSNPGAVLVSPSMMEGVDLTGERGEWTAVIKASYPYLGDRRINRRRMMPDGQRWYEQQVVEDTIQALGRVVRGPTERANRYIMDGALVNLLIKWWGDLPPWFKEPCEVGRPKVPALLNDLLPPASSIVT